MWARVKVHANSQHSRGWADGGCNSVAQWMSEKTVDRIQQAAWRCNFWCWEDRIFFSSIWLFVTAIQTSITTLARMNCQQGRKVLQHLLQRHTKLCACKSLCVCVCVVKLIVKWRKDEWCFSGLGVTCNCLKQFLPPRNGMQGRRCKLCCEIIVT